MPLPGKLCIGILEEDNPLKSYFRFKPLLIEKEGLYIPYDEPDSYPEDGCIRIVPDKNESSHFKARMRRMGLFAVVDLRAHPNENDKIRVNKNYHGDDTERNAQIIYSDVVREPAAGTIFAIINMSAEDAQSATLTAAPDTPQILLRAEDSLLDGVWSVVPAEDQENVYALQRSEQSVAEPQVFDITGFNGAPLSFAILPPSGVENVAEPIAAKLPKPVVAEVRREAEVKPAEPAPAPAPAPAAAPAEKPWLNSEPAISAISGDPHISHIHQALAAQCGLNPRRGRSLQEIIDDKWRHSRIDQLGHPVPGTANATPMNSPAESALNAMRNAWELPDQREALLSSLVAMEGLEDALDIRRAAARESAVNAQLTDLEAQRLEMLADLENLKRRRVDLRETLKQEIRQDEAAAFADAVRKTEQAKAECSRHQEAAARAKTAAACAEDALSALVDGRFEQRLEDFAINSRAAELLRRMDVHPAAPEVVTCSADAEELIRRVMETFECSGAAISRQEAVNLLICAAQSPVLLVSGPAGSGKTTAINLLAKSLGITGSRYAVFAPGKASLESDARAAALMNSEAPAIALLDDANLFPGEDLARGLTPASEQSNLLLCITLQDDGSPVPAYLLGRAFMVRLSDDASSPWQPAVRQMAADCAPVSREALCAAFAPQPDAIPQAVLKRMEKFRADLALLNVRLSRKTLDALWNYCAAAIPVMASSPMEVLDLALAQRAIPAILASAPLKALVALPKLLEDLPGCKKLLNQPLPINL